MNIYEKISNDILKLKTANRKIYKPILILSYIDYLKDTGSDFNTKVSIFNLIDYINIYIETADLLDLIIDKNQKTGKEILKSKSKDYNSYKNKLSNLFRRMPLTKIVNDSKENHFFQNEFGYEEKLTRKLEELPYEFIILIKENYDRDKLINIIRYSCQEKIKLISKKSIKIEDFDKIKKEDKDLVENGKFLDVNQLYYERSNVTRSKQYIFKRQLLEKHNKTCALCNLSIERLLIASHAKPWVKCEDVHEKLSPNNGLLLCPNHDALFDKGLITFDENNNIIFSKYIDDEQNKTLLEQGISKSINISEKEKKYFKYHRDYVFKKEQS